MTITPEQIDRERLRENAAEGGPWGEVVLALLDALDEARAEVRTERQAAREVLDEHRCDEQAERAYRRAVAAEAAVDQAERERDEAQAAVQRVRKIHEPAPVSECTTACSCGWWSHADCPHVQALDGGGES